MDQAVSWERCLDLLQIGKGVIEILTRVEELSVWTTLVIKQPLYYGWWAKLTARHTWKELVMAKEKAMENERYAVRWKTLEYHSAPHLDEGPYRTHQVEKTPKNKTLNAAELDTLIERVENWKEGIRGAPPPSAQPTPKREDWDVEVAVPVYMVGPQYAEGELEGRAKVGLFQDVMSFMLELTEVEDIGDGKWWDNAVAHVWTPERKANMASKLRKDWYRK